MRNWLSFKLLPLLFIVFIGFSASAQSPGGISTNLNLWLKANSGPEKAGSVPAANGETISVWKDRSAAGNDYIGVSTPTVQDNTLNFNPSVEILSGGFDAPALAALPATWTVFFISQKLASDNNGRLFDGNTGNYLWAHWGTYTNGIYLNGNPASNGSGIATTSGIQNLHLHSYKRESTGQLEARADGFSFSPPYTYATSNSASGIRIDINQGAYAASESSNSRVGEMIIYNTPLSAGDVEKVESYLGIKYGLTLAHDYVASDGTVIWNYAGSTLYNNNIAGIGIDNNIPTGSGLDQPKSKSINAGSITTMERVGAFANLDFIVWGNNNAANGTSSDVPATYGKRINKIWKTKATNAPGAVSISINLTDLGLPIALNASDYGLILDGDETFSDTGTPSVLGSSISNGLLTFSSVTFTGTQYFTVAVKSTALKGPANVTDNLKLWLKANTGVVPAPVLNTITPVTGWSDQSGNGYTAAQTVNPPDLLNDAPNLLNNNPVIDFTSNNQEQLKITGGIMGLSTYNHAWTYAVMKGDISQNNTLFYESLTGGETFNVLLPWGGSFYYDFGNHSTGRINGAWGGSLNNYNFWTFGASNSTATPNGKSRTVSRDGVEVLSNTTSTDFGTGNNQPFFIGGGYDTGPTGDATINPLDGKIAELIVFTSPPTALEQEKIQSYLAVKYGITKNSPLIGNTPGQDERDYFNSNGDVIWSYLNSVYHNNVAGIGFDNGSGLSQMQSRSVNAGADITMNGAIATDLSYVVWGDNNAANGTSSDVPAAYAKRLAKVWKTSATGTPGPIDVTIDLTDLGLPIGLPAANYGILLDGDATTFTDAIATSGSTRTGSLLTFSGITFSGTQFFTVAVLSTALNGPANVTDNLKLWLKADADVVGGATVTNWNDQSGNGYNATNPSVGAPKPAWDNVNLLNFNPVVDFTNSHMKINGGIMGNNSYTSSWTYAVLKGDVAQQNTLFYESLAGNETFNVLLPWGNIFYLDFGNTGGTGRINVASGSSLVAYNMWTAGATTSATSPLPGGMNKGLSRDGLLLSSLAGADATVAGNNQPFFIGGGYNTGLTADGTQNQMDGKIAELIVFTGVPTELEQEKIQTYLGIKYGITKNSADAADATVDGRNYFASDGTTIWDYAASSIYHNNVAGIGLDLNTAGAGINQMQSRSSNAGADVTMNGVISTNKSYLVWGDNNAVNGTSTNVPASTYIKRLNKIWKTNITNTVGAVNISIDLTDLGLPVSLSASDYALLIDGDTDFSNALEYTTGAVINNGQLSFTSVPFIDDGYFTVAVKTTALKGPANVTENLKLWLKADAGVIGGGAITNWNDQSGNGYNAMTPGASPVHLTSQPNLLNFNPVVDFTNSHMKINGGIMGTNSYTSSWIYAVMKGDVIQNNTFLYESLAGNETFNILLPWGNNNFYLDFGNTGGTGRINITSGATVNAYNLWTASATTSATSPLPATMNKGLSRDGTLLTSLAGADATVAGNNQPFFIGGGYNTGLTADGTVNQLDGKIAELIVFTGVPTELEQEKIQSYLAIKYGITKNSADAADVTVDGRNYFASDGATIWNYSTGTYHNRVTGIGRDDASQLNQLKSTSIQTGPVLTLEKKAPFFSAGIHYVVTGDDAGVLASSSASVPAPYTKRLTRVWSTNVKGSPGAISISFDLSTGIHNSGNGADYALLINNGAATFGSPTSTLTGGTIVNNVLTFDNVTLSGGDYFTLGIIVNTPGGVPGSVFWVKGDLGVTATPDVSIWADQSGGGNNAVQANSVNQPSVGATVNFNPTVDFSGGTDILTITSPPATSNTTVFTVGVPTGPPGNTTWRTMFRGTSNDHQLIIQSGNNALGYYDNAGTGPTGLQASSFSWGQNETALIGLEMLTGNVNFRKNGIQGPSITTIDPTGISLNYFGNYQGGGQNFGAIAETIIFSGSALLPAEKDKIESYLAVKYAITLTHDYLNTNGITTWSTTTNTGYNNGITGIGRDDNTALLQLKSKSTISGSVLTLEKAAPALNNLEFAIAGNDGGALSATTVGALAGPSFPMRVTRVWRAQVTPAAGTGIVKISFDLGTGIYNSGNVNDYALLKGNGSNFTAVTPITSNRSLAAGVISFDNVSLADGEYFTLGLPFITSPGNVINNLTVWLKADEGVLTPGMTPATDGSSVGQWTDQTSLLNHGAATLIPFYNTTSNLINFNPTIYYDGTSGHNLTYSVSSQYTMFTMARLEGTQNGRVFSSRNSNSFLGFWNNRQDVVYLNNNPSHLTGQPASTNPRLHTFWREPSGGYQFYTNGGILNSGSTSTNVTWQMGIGNGGQSTGEKSKAYVSELIIYDRTLTTAEINSVQSYLGVKYGITLDQTTPTNYVASDGTIIWNSAASPTGNASYKNNIAGIGRDNDTRLNQIKSRSINAKSVVIMDKGGALANKTFLMWGQDSSPLAPTSVGAVLPTYPYRVSRIWRVDQTGAVGTVSVSFDLGVGIFNSGIATDYALVQKTSDTDFSTGATVNDGVSGATPSFDVPGGNILTFHNISFNDGDYFTLALPNITAPGGVVGNIQLWLKANTIGAPDGTAVASWLDNSGNGFHVTQATNGSKPITHTNQANFNPTVQFDGVDDQLTLTGGIMGTATYSDFNAIMVSRANANVTNTLFYETQSAGGRINVHAPWNNNNIYWDAGDAGTNRLNGTWGGAINNHFLWSLTASATATASGAKQDIYRNGLRILNDNTLNPFTGNNSNFFLGSQGGSSFYNGDFSEVILYTGSLSTTQLQRINSYFALKYGLTLDQTLPQNYFASDGSVFYHATTTHGGYLNDITGIGRDDNSALDQRKSQTANIPSDIFAASNNDFTTPAAFSTNLEFLVWAHNGLPVTSDPTTPSISNHGGSADVIVRRLARNWTTDKTGTHSGNLIIEMDVNQIGGQAGPGSNANDKLRLIVDDNLTFGEGVAGEHLYSPDLGYAASGGKIYFTVPYADISAQAFITLGSVDIVNAPLMTPTPGGVAASMRLWLKANTIGASAGSPVATWNDFSGNGFNAQASASQPVVSSNVVNFNPSVVFNGSNQNFNISSGIFRSNTYTDANVFIVSRVNTVQNGHLMYESNAGGNFITYVPWGDNTLYWDAGNSGTSRLNGNWGGTINQSYLWSLNSSTNNTTSGPGVKQDVYRNGLRFLNDNTMISFSGNNSTYYLGSGPNSNYYNGEISEVIVLSSALTTSQFQRVHSYLAIKYGITLNQNTPQNYFSSTDAILYHSTTTHAGYRYDITGIGRDDNSALSQLKSKNINTTPTVVTLANGDFTTPTAFLTTGEFLMWGHNGLPYEADAATPAYTHGGASIQRQLARVWSTDKTGNPSGNVIIEMDMSVIGGPLGVAGSNANVDVRLLVDDNNIFGEVAAPPTQHAYTPDTGIGYAATGGKIYFVIPYADIASGQGFFTLGSVNTLTAPISIPYPGGVASNIKLWIKANDGPSTTTDLASVSGWNDRSGNAFAAAQLTGANQPTFRDSRVNFNPAIQFDGVNDRMTIANGILGTSVYNDVNVFSVGRANALGGFLFHEPVTGGGSRLSVFQPQTDGNIYWDAGGTAAPYRLSTGWGGTLGNNYLWSLSASTTGTSTGARQDIFRNALRINFDNDYTTFTGNNANFNIGSDGTGTFHNGEISELALYTGPLTSIQMQRVHSYLAIKYGLTLDQSTAQDYLASNATVIYHTTTTHNGYKNQITGIGRDDDSALDQRRSKSVVTNSIITMAKDVLAAPFVTDKDFLVWGDDGLSNGPTTVGAVNTTYPTRMTKTWRVDTNGSPGLVTVSFDLNAGIYNSTIATDYALLIKNANNDFTTGSPTIYTTGASISSGVLSFTGVNFTDGDYFTLAMPRIPAPGGVINNLRVWLKANAGITAADGAPALQWIDQTQLGNNATQTGTPTYFSTTASKLINFNPTVYYDGASGHNLTYSVSGAYTIFTMSRLEGTQNRRVFSSRSSNFLVGYYNGKENVLHINGTPSLLTGVVASTTPRLYSLVRSATVGAYSMFNSGALLYSGPSSDAAAMQLSMGNGGQSNESSRAYVSESIIYDTNLTLPEINAVQSYLAIKYGFTIDQTAATNYVSGDGTVIWNGTTFSTYNKNITGIGRDDRSALDQRKSKSINTAAIVTIENAASAPTFTVDKSFIIFGNDANLLGATSSNVVAAYPYRVNRAWRANVTGTTGKVDISFDLTTGIYNSNNPDDYGLMIKQADAIFSTGTVTVNNKANATIAGTPIPTLSAGILTFHEITLNDGDHFSLALPIVPAPGGVVDGMRLWVKANTLSSTPVTTWSDQSGNGFNLSQATVANKPTFLPGDINYNPSVQFSSASSTQLILAGGIMGTSVYNDLNVFSLARTNAITPASSLFYETQSAGGRLNIHLPFTDNVAYWDAGSGGSPHRLQVAWGGAVNTNYLWGFLASNTGPTVSGGAVRQEIYRNGSRLITDTNMGSFTGNNSQFSLGSGGGGSYYNGEVAEHVIYTTALSLQQFQRIQSYFAVKYGITLSQATPTDYYASDWNGTTGTLIWNSTSAGTYKNNIAAIGLDNKSALDQKQSASINAGNVLVIAHNNAITTSASTGSAFAGDKSFFSWAHNNLVLDGQGITDLPTSPTAIQSRVARVWQGQETSVVGSVHLKFNLSTVIGVGGVVGNNDMNQVRLLVDADGVFATGATIVGPSSVDNTAHTVEFDFDFPSGAISYFTVGSVDKATAPLPIHLVSFTATPKEDKVLVAWKTLTELDNDFFTVQSSLDGFEWGEVQEVKGAGNSSTPKTYEITDETPFIGKSYYRLRQTDFDGKETYSKAVEVTVNEGSIKVYPNPVSDGKINIQIKDNLSDQVQIRLLDSHQRELKSQTYQRNTSQQSTISLDLPEELPSGMYYLKIIDKVGIRYRRIIVN